MPSTRSPNYAYKNVAKGYKFVNKAEDWGLDAPSHSNGSVYADLDNDGDLELIVNNTNQAPFIWRNNAETLRAENHSISLDLRNENGATAIGAKVYGYAGGDMFYAELVPMKGFQSSVDPRIHLGVGAHTSLDSLTIVWGENTSHLTSVAADSLYVLTAADAQPTQLAQAKSRLLEPSGTYGGRTENKYSQFNEERLIPQMVTTEGARVASADINGDGYVDIYQCGAAGEAGKLFYGSDWYGFEEAINSPFNAHAESEDTDAQFFDYDGDGDLDLYVASGSMEAENNSIVLFDRIYKNVGGGKLVYDENALPASCTLFFYCGGRF